MQLALEDEHHCEADCPENHRDDECPRSDIEPFASKYSSIEQQNGKLDRAESNCLYDVDGIFSLKARRCQLNVLAKSSKMRQAYGRVP